MNLDVRENYIPLDFQIFYLMNTDILPNLSFVQEHDPEEFEATPLPVHVYQWSSSQSKSVITPHSLFSLHACFASARLLYVSILVPEQC